MARTDLVVQTVTSAGIVTAYTAANAQGHSYYNDGRVLVTVKNGSGSTVTVTAQTPGTVDSLAIADKTYPILAAAEITICLPTGAYNQPDGSTDANKAYLDFSAVTSVTIAALHHP